MSAADAAERGMNRRGAARVDERRAAPVIGRVGRYAPRQNR